MIPDLHVGLEIRNEMGLLLSISNNWMTGPSLVRVPAGAHDFDLDIDALHLMPGRYYLTLWLKGPDSRNYDLLENCLMMDVETSDWYGTGRGIDPHFGLHVPAGALAGRRAPDRGRVTGGRLRAAAHAAVEGLAARAVASRCRHRDLAAPRHRLRAAPGRRDARLRRAHRAQARARRTGHGRLRDRRPHLARALPGCRRAGARRRGEAVAACGELGVAADEVLLPGLPRRRADRRGSTAAAARVADLLREHPGRLLLAPYAGDTTADHQATLAAVLGGGRVAGTGQPRARCSSTPSGSGTTGRGCARRWRAGCIAPASCWPGCGRAARRLRAPAAHGRRHGRDRDQAPRTGLPRHADRRGRPTSRAGPCWPTSPAGSGWTSSSRGREHFRRRRVPTGR